ncbi:MAG: T9SS type A sorting domain-containing protein, partial [Rubricoccaceae bacterium]|nr:T9SS type A sorting domain-containing protein [Rubricoccaceae bacterium]
GVSHEGRVAGAFWAGMGYSDDDGASWAESSLWGVGGQYDAIDVAIGVDGRVYAAFGEVGVGGLQVAVSEDGGRSYAEPYSFGEYRGVINKRIFALPGGADPGVGVVVVVQADGTVWRSDDGAGSFRLVGAAPVEQVEFHQDSVVGPDGRLYVSVNRIGTTPEWVYRTAGPAVGPVVAVEAEPVGVPPGDPVVVGPEGGSFSFAVQLANETTVPLAVEAWSAVEGPVVREPVAGPAAVSLAPLSPSSGWSRVVRQSVPASAPPGTYVYTVRAGDLSAGEVLAEASFEIVKEAGSPLGADDGAGWTAEGWDDGAAAGDAPGSVVSLSVSPNPSRGAAAVSLTLSEAADAEVAVYDVLGRRVVVLHEGTLAAGRHAFGLGGARLGPGVYVVRVTTGSAAAAATVTVFR